MIKRYRNKKIVQFAVGVLSLIGVYFFVNTDLIQIGIWGIIIFYGIAYNAKLLTDIKSNDGFYIFETYSILTQKEEIKISELQLTQILYQTNSLFKSHNLILKYNGTNGVISKKLYLNAEPWSELTSELSRIKNLLPTNV